MFISLGFLSKKMLVPLLIPFIYTFRHYILKINEEKGQSVFLNTFVASLSYSLNIVLLIIENQRVKSSKKEIQDKEYKNQLLIEKRKIKLKKVKKKYIFLLLISLYNYSNFQVYDIIKIFKPEDYIQYHFYSLSITVYFISTAVMSYLLLATQIYTHQKLSMIISPILSTIMFSVFIKYFPMKTLNIIYLCLCLLLRNFRFILMVFGKLFMEKYFISQFELLSFFGIFGLLFSIITNFISYYLNFDFFEYKKEFEGKKLRTFFGCWKLIDKKYFFGSVIFWFIENNLIWYCISTLSPNHYIIYRNISSTFNIIKELYNNSNKYIQIISFISLAGIFICGLIFNEIIIIHICKFDKYTAVELNKRQKEEIENNLKEMVDNEIVDDTSERSY